jgi:hypothetical protein
MIKLRVLVSIIEACYIIYMFRYFKTTFSFSLLPLKIFDNSFYLKHLQNNTKNPESHICPFGHDMAFVIGFYLVIRNYSYCLLNYNNWIIGFIFIGCFLNFNCVAYFLPVIIVEVIFYFIKV